LLATQNAHTQKRARKVLCHVDAAINSIEDINHICARPDAKISPMPRFISIWIAFDEGKTKVAQKYAAMILLFAGARL
jgi:hypothetical protein